MVRASPESDVRAGSHRSQARPEPWLSCASTTPGVRCNTCSVTQTHDAQRRPSTASRIPPPEVDRPVICDVVVDRTENVYPMIPGGAAHNEIRLCPEDEAPVQGSEEGMVLV